MQCIKRHILICGTKSIQQETDILLLLYFLIKDCTVNMQSRSAPVWWVSLNQGQPQYDEYLSSRYLFGTHIWRGPASTWRARWADLSPLAPAWGGMRARTRNRWVRRYPDTWSTPCEDMSVNGHVTKHQEPYNKVWLKWMKQIWRGTFCFIVSLSVWIALK